MKSFDESILAIIKKLEYDIWMIVSDKHISCPCKNYDTDQGDKYCPYCFGLGYKIKIKKIKGVRQPMSIQADKMKIDTEVGVYFFKQDYKIKDDDILIWNDEVEQVTRTDRFCSDSQTPVYYRCETTPKKTNIKFLLESFKRVIKKKG